MAKHPKAHEEEDEFDSTKQREADKAKIRAEIKTEAEDREISNFKGLPQEGETRDQLIARIRKMRDESVPVEAKVETFRSEGLQKTFEAEQEAGRAAVAKAQAEADRYRELRQAQEAGEKNQTG